MESCEQWSTKENPADLISRGCSAQTLIKSKLWNNGPEFLCSENTAPQNFTPSIDENDEELKIVSTVLTSKTDDSPLDAVMNSSSSWFVLKKRVAFLLLVRQALHQKVGLKKCEINVTLLKQAEVEIIKYFQNLYYFSEIHCCTNNSNLPKNSPLRKLNPFLDMKGLLRVGGRLSRSTFSYDTKHPIIMPNSRVAEVILQEMHRSLGHLGRETLLASIRRRYHVMNVRSVIDRMLRECVICRKINGRTCQQLMSDLPSRRVTGDTSPFTNTGTDLFGPFIVTRGRKTEKRYGVIFTCMSSRAIHLEIAESLSTDSYINSLRRFICRRGNVKTVTSDNGTNLTSAHNELKQSINEWNQAHIRNSLHQCNIDWHFNVPTSSHHGGAYEREIRTIRKTLNSVTSSQNIRLRDEELNTLMCEVEAILNNRPLVETSNDSGEALTPNNLLIFNSGITFPPGVFNKDDTYAKRRWRQVQYLADLFWRRWSREYVVTLQERQKWTKTEDNLKPKDLVLVVEPNTPRNCWPMGIVTTVNTDRRGFVRSATVKISRCKNSNLNDFSCAELERPIVKLVKILSS